MQLADTPTFECHPPERRRRTEIRMCHGSCCCCCCCLHTVGGIVGAVVAPKLGSQATAWSHLSLIDYWDEEEFEPGQTYGAKGDPEAITEDVPAAPARPVMRAGAVPDIAKAGISAVRVFWLLTLGFSVLGAFLGIVQQGPIVQQGATGFVVVLVIMALVFPAVQLVSAIIVAIWLSTSVRPDKWFQLRQVGKITLGVFLGTVAGILAMVVIGMLWSWLAR